MPNATVSVAYSQTITGSGGTAPYTFVVTIGPLPGGLTLTPGGVLAGTPLAAGTFPFTVRGTDANGCVAQLPYNFFVATAAPTLPQAFAITLSAGLLTIGYVRLRRRARAR